MDKSRARTGPASKSSKQMGSAHIELPPVNKQNQHGKIGVGKHFGNNVREVSLEVKNKQTKSIMSPAVASKPVTSKDPQESKGSISVNYGQKKQLSGKKSVEQSFENHNANTSAEVPKNLMGFPSVKQAQLFSINGKRLPKGSHSVSKNEYLLQLLPSQKLTTRRGNPNNSKLDVRSSENYIKKQEEKAPVKEIKDGDIIFEPFHADKMSLSSLFAKLSTTIRADLWQSMHNNLDQLEPLMKDDCHIRTWMKYSCGSNKQKLSKEVEGVAIYAKDVNSHHGKKIEILHVCGPNISTWTEWLETLISHIWTTEQGCEEITISIKHLKAEDGKLAANEGLVKALKGLGFKWKSLVNSAQGERHTVYYLKRGSKVETSGFPFKLTSVVVVGNRPTQEASMSHIQTSDEKTLHCMTYLCLASWMNFSGKKTFEKANPGSLCSPLKGAVEILQKNEGLELEMGKYCEVLGCKALKNQIGKQLIDKKDQLDISAEFGDREDEGSASARFGVNQIDLSLRFKTFSMQVFCGGVYAKVSVASRFTILQNMSEGFLIESNTPDIFFMVILKSSFRSKLLTYIKQPIFSLEWARNKLEKFIQEDPEQLIEGQVESPELNQATSHQKKTITGRSHCNLWIPSFAKREKLQLCSGTLLSLNAGLGLDELTGVSEAHIWANVDLDYPVFQDSVCSSYHRDDVLVNKDFDFFVISKTLYAILGLPMLHVPVSQLDFLSPG